jgi:hypothetical protein
MSLKTVSQISLAIVSLVFIVQLVELYSYLQIDSEWVTTTERVCRVVDALLWLPFMLFFWKIIKG